MSTAAGAAGTAPARRAARARGLPTRDAALRHAPDGAATRRLRAALLRWYDAQRRPLPWRRDRDPYRVWVAEVMLQQTRVDVAVPKFERFVRRFPDLATLACAREESVLAAWSGLGYYTRARSLHRAARALRTQGIDTFPSDPEVAAKLPGVGRYTLGAVLSIAYDLAYTALDANVVRVLSRLACLPRPDARGAPHDALAERLLDRVRPGDWNQALMELGETVCLPRAPRCDACPLAAWCAAHARGLTHAHPPPKPRRATERIRVALTLLHDTGGRLLLERGAFPFLPHLWLPLAEVGDAARGSGTSAGTFRHAILHRQLDVEVYVDRASATELARRAALPLDEPGSAGGHRRRDVGAGATGKSGDRIRANARAPERRTFTRAQRARIGRSSLLTKALALAFASSEPRASR